jgi:hypothetical protein
MRYAFTIIYNGKHHLLHKEFAERMVSMFDKWVIVEGFSRNGGSTAWCTSIRPPSQSTDGTIELCQSLQSNKVIFATSQTGWSSKDEQVNKAMELLQGSEPGWLWQVDADEHWTTEDLEGAESMLQKDIKLAGGFQFYHYLCKDVDGRQLVGKGAWGDNIHTRLWWWRGQKFISHEPPKMVGQDGVRLLPRSITTTHIILSRMLNLNQNTTEDIGRCYLIGGPYKSVDLIIPSLPKHCWEAPPPLTLITPI